eukprot:CAMPEP_0177675920 /NCGR_PEP_ID=MMETSP0447-20121125/27482_1 /TAXON_ID=0 /ORGANISM="Stygamoeba regulata, Strain BSH-02190019" /LENGTH=1029 /DNA_ID=CAMNT_0019184387 /DNA_START=75 /DNA_END=3160 /DNA_ORIENTATION=+
MWSRVLLSILLVLWGTSIASANLSTVSVEISAGSWHQHFFHVLANTSFFASVGASSSDLDLHLAWFPHQPVEGESFDWDKEDKTVPLQLRFDACHSGYLLVGVYNDDWYSATAVINHEVLSTSVHLCRYKPEVTEQLGGHYISRFEVLRPTGGEATFIDTPMKVMWVAPWSPNIPYTTTFDLWNDEYGPLNTKILNMLDYSTSIEYGQFYFNCPTETPLFFGIFEKDLPTSLEYFIQASGTRMDATMSDETETFSIFRQEQSDAPCLSAEEIGLYFANLVYSDVSGKITFQGEVFNAEVAPKTYSTDAALYLSADRPLAVVAYAGTSSVLDFATDVVAIPVSCSGIAGGCNGGWIHAGFSVEYKEAQNFFRDQLRMLIAKGPHDIVFCGHSLGAAAATIAALDLTRYHNLNVSRTYLVTAGSPRVGTSDFVSAVDSLGIQSIRYISGSGTSWFDAITTLPPGYSHISLRHGLTCASTSRKKQTRASFTCHSMGYYMWAMFELGEGKGVLPSLNCDSGSSDVDSSSSMGSSSSESSASSDSSSDVGSSSSDSSSSSDVGSSSSDSSSSDVGSSSSDSSSDLGSSSSDSSSGISAHLSAEFSTDGDIVQGDQVLRIELSDGHSFDERTYTEAAIVRQILENCVSPNFATAWRQCIRVMTTRSDGFLLNRVIRGENAWSFRFMTIVDFQVAYDEQLDVVLNPLLSEWIVDSSLSVTDVTSSLSIVHGDPTFTVHTLTFSAPYIGGVNAWSASASLDDSKFTYYRTTITPSITLVLLPSADAPLNRFLLLGQPPTLGAENAQWSDDGTETVRIDVGNVDVAGYLYFAIDADPGRNPLNKYAVTVWRFASSVNLCDYEHCENGVIFSQELIVVEPRHDAVLVSGGPLAIRWTSPGTTCFFPCDVSLLEELVLYNEQDPTNEVDLLSTIPMAHHRDDGIIDTVTPLGMENLGGCYRIRMTGAHARFGPSLSDCFSIVDDLPDDSSSNGASSDSASSSGSDSASSSGSDSASSSGSDSASSSGSDAGSDSASSSGS